MARNLPPLNWLRAFEAAARHGGFLRAGRELRVSAGAVSQQVRALESWLGVALFTRQPRGVSLTAAGRVYGERIGPMLDGLADATRDAARGGETQRLRIVALPAMAERWLTPRLSRFHALHPECAVDLTTAESIEMAAETGFDVAIHYGGEAQRGMSATMLFRDEIFPVCAPGLAVGLADEPGSALTDCRLLYDTKWIGDWSHWAAAAGIATPDLSQGLGFSLYSMAVAAAVDEQGMLIGHRALIERELASGALVAPFRVRTPTRHHYVALTDRRAVPGIQVESFLSWLSGEAAAGPAAS